MNRLFCRWRGHKWLRYQHTIHDEWHSEGIHSCTRCGRVGWWYAWTIKGFDRELRRSEYAESIASSLYAENPLLRALSR